MSSHRIRSTSDEMLAARHDKAPWVDRNGDRYAHPRLTGAPVRFAPRVECIPSRDPYPYVEVAPGVGNTGRRYTSREQAPSVNMTFRPRPAYARPEPNPILVDFRDDPHLTAPERAHDYLLYLVQHREHVKRAYTPVEIEDARKVLTRLVEVFG